MPVVFTKEVGVRLYASGGTILCSLSAYDQNTGHFRSSSGVSIIARGRGKLIWSLHRNTTCPVANKASA